MLCIVRQPTKCFCYSLPILFFGEQVYFLMCLMASDNRMKIYLGYEDEYVTDKYRSLVNFMTNKIGGLPNNHGANQIPLPICKLCGVRQLLVLQIYAPLENSDYHRTLYIFTCINPNCWNQNGSWTCFRVQSLDNTSKTNSSEKNKVEVPSSTFWLSSADDWGDNMNDIASEDNGNDDNHVMKIRSDINLDKKLTADFTALCVDDPNANSPTSIESPFDVGAVGRLDSPHAHAEIDGEESEIVCIDTPTQPLCDVISLLQDVEPIPLHLKSKEDMDFQFTEIFISVDEEDHSNDIPQHVRDLLLEYQNTNPEIMTSLRSEKKSESKNMEAADTEKYEKSIPIHGDEMFHNFACRIKKNPSQILRYSRNNSAQLLLYPLNEIIPRCRNCGSEMIFEIQILPTLIPKLNLCPHSEKNFQLEYGNILIYTCLKSCWLVTDSYKEEYVIVQAERL